MLLLLPYENHPRWENRTLVVHEQVDGHICSIGSSRSSFTEITEYTYCMLLKPSREFMYTSQNFVPLDLIIRLISICET